jgi:hypothetical protein
MHKPSVRVPRIGPPPLPHLALPSGRRDADAMSTREPSLPSNVRDVLVLVERRLSPHGWHVDAVPSRANTFQIVVRHVLTSDRSIVISAAEEDEVVQRFIESRLEDPEFDRIARSPDRQPHAALLGDIRRAAEANLWTEDVMRPLAGVLGAHGVLTNEEADWLGGAGPAWAR